MSLWIAEENRAIAWWRMVKTSRPTLQFEAAPMGEGGNDAPLLLRKLQKDAAPGSNFLASSLDFG